MSWTVSEEWHARAKEALIAIARVETLARTWASDAYCDSDITYGDAAHDVLEALGRTHE